jgi:hypothetical protein
MRAQVPKTTVVSFNLPTELVERLRADARQCECSMSAVVRASLRRRYATQDEQKPEVIGLGK